MKIKLLFLSLLMLAMGGSLSAQSVVVGASCPASGQNAIATNGQPVLCTQNGSGLLVWTGVPGGSSSGTTSVGGTFGGSPSSGYTFTSTPITTAPFSGNLLIGAVDIGNNNGTFSAGAGYTLVGTPGASGSAMEYNLSAGSGSSLSAPMTYSVSNGWSGTITAFTCVPTCAFVQGTAVHNATTLAFGSNNGSGNLLVAAISYNTSLNGGPITGVTCNSNTWKLAGGRVPGTYNKGTGNGNFLEFWYGLNSNSGACTVTPAGISSATGIDISIAELSGAQTTGVPVDYAFAGSTTAVTSIPGATTNTQYTINAVNNATGTIDFTGRDSAAVFRAATNAKAGVGGLLYYKLGVYPCQVALQESVASQTNFYCNGIAAPPGVAGNQVAWHIVCETVTQPTYAAVDPNGCIHQILPSAYAGSEPANLKLSGFWQRPNSTLGAIGNNQVYIVNGVVRLPDNQRTATTAYDLFTTSYSSHVGTTADTNIAAVDQLCSGLTVPNPNIIGYTSNQSGSDEAYYENTWTIGMGTGYNTLTNHPVFINSHAACGNIAGTLAVSIDLYGGTLLHFQDIHNIVGLQFNCTQTGTKFDFINGIVENAQSGAFTRVHQATENTPGNCVVTGSVTTGAANGAAATAGSFWDSGSGTNSKVAESDRVVTPGLVNANFTSAATTGTSKQTLATYTFAINTNANGITAGPFLNNSGAVFRMKAWGITAATANSKTLEIDFGGTAIATITSSVNAGSIKCEAEIIVSSVANTQEISGECVDSSGAKTFVRTAPGITGNANIITNIAATTPTASGDFTFKGLTIEYVGGQ